MKTKKHTKSLRAIMFIIWVILLPIGTATAAPGDCLAYAYTQSGNHAFLIQENSSNFGNNILTKKKWIILLLLSEGLIGFLLLII